MTFSFFINIFTKGIFLSLLDSLSYFLDLTWTGTALIVKVFTLFVLYFKSSSFKLVLITDSSKYEDFSNPHPLEYYANWLHLSSYTAPYLNTFGFSNNFYNNYTLVAFSFATLLTTVVNLIKYLLAGPQVYQSYQSSDFNINLIGKKENSKIINSDHKNCQKITIIFYIFLLILMRIFIVSQYKNTFNIFKSFFTKAIYLDIAFLGTLGFQIYALYTLRPLKISEFKLKNFLPSLSILVDVITRLILIQTTNLMYYSLFVEQIMEITMVLKYYYSKTNTQKIKHYFSKDFLRTEKISFLKVFNRRELTIFQKLEDVIKNSELLQVVLGHFCYMLIDFGTVYLDFELNSDTMVQFLTQVSDALVYTVVNLFLINNNY